MEPGRFPLRARLGMWALSLTLAACTDRQLPTAVPTRADRASMSTASAGSRLLTLGSAKLWIGLKNSDDVGLRLDVRAEVLLNGVVVGSGELLDVPGGSSGFNNAVLRTIDLAMNGDVSVPPGAVLTFRPSVRRTCIGTGHKSGTVRLWYDGPAIDQGTTRNAGSRFAATVGTESSDYFMRNPAALSVTAGTARQFVDVAVNSTAACPARPFSSLGEWNVIVPGQAPPSVMIALSNTDQFAAAGSAVDEPPSVRVVDEWGNPVAGVSVTFTATVPGTVIGTPVITDGNGVATVGGWTLGTTIGTSFGSLYPLRERLHRVNATAGALGATFWARAVAGPPASVTLIPNCCNPFVAPINTLGGGEQETFGAFVADAYGNAIAGEAVTFSSSDPTAANVLPPARLEAGGGSTTVPFTLMDFGAAAIATDRSVEIRASAVGRPDLYSSYTITVTKTVNPVATNDVLNLPPCPLFGCNGIQTFTFNVLTNDNRGSPTAVITRFREIDDEHNPFRLWSTAGSTVHPWDNHVGTTDVTLTSDGTLTVRVDDLQNPFTDAAFSTTLYYDLKNFGGTSTGTIVISRGSNGSGALAAGAHSTGRRLSALD